MSTETLKRKADVPTDQLKVEFQPSLDDKKIKRVAQASSSTTDLGKSVPQKPQPAPVDLEDLAK
jgi:hypothetical protein